MHCCDLCDVVNTLLCFNDLFGICGKAIILFCCFKAALLWHPLHIMKPIHQLMLQQLEAIIFPLMRVAKTDVSYFIHRTMQVRRLAVCKDIPCLKPRCMML